jgi:MoaA/NifB/PqqE/SkfB family radical SAM enzyme
MEAKGFLSAFAGAARKLTSGASVHRLRKVYVEPTTKCNLRCHTCMRHSWDEPAADMQMATYARLLDGLRKIGTIQTVAYWGIGEPLMHPRIVAMIASAHAIGMQTELITNGQLLSDKMATGLVDAGLDRIVVSLHGPRIEGPVTDDAGSNPGRIRENLHALRRARQGRGLGKPEIAVEFVLARSNLGQLQHLPRTAQDLGASTVYLTNVLPYSRDLGAEILYALSAVSETFAIRFEQTNGFVLPRFDARPEILEALRNLPVRASRDSRHPLDVPPTYRGQCPFLERGALAVRWDGGVSPCVELLHSHVVYVIGREKHVQPYVLGSLERQALEEIWQGTEYWRFRERLQEFDFSPCVGCGGCDMAESNGEDCIGSPFPSCGDCLWARGVILCP